MHWVSGEEGDSHLVNFLLNEGNSSFSFHFILCISFRAELIEERNTVH